MTAKLILGKEVSSEIYGELRQRIEALKAKGVTPGLAVVLVGEDPASQVYVRKKGEMCEELGMKSLTVLMPEETTQEELLAKVAELNADPSIHGFLVQLPLPAHIDEEAVINAIDPSKDVDCFHPSNVGRMLIGNPDFLPATSAGVQQMLVRSGVETAGKHVVVVGRSNIVGKPMHGGHPDRRDRQAPLRHRGHGEGGGHGHRRGHQQDRRSVPSEGEQAGRRRRFRGGQGEGVVHNPGPGRRRTHDHLHADGQRRQGRREGGRVIRECEDHGYFRSERCPYCGEEGKFIMSDFEVEKIGRTLAAILRHGKFGLEMDSHGNVSLKEVMAKIRERNPRMNWLRARHIEALVETDPKGRYVISNGKIRATYGHTIPLDIRLDCENIPDELFYPATPEEAELILESGIFPSDRAMVHLSRGYRDAVRAGSVRTEDPVILVIDTGVCMELGSDIGRAAKTVYLCRSVPADAIDIADPEDWDSEEEDE